MAFVHTVTALGSGAVAFTRGFGAAVLALGRRINPSSVLAPRDEPPLRADLLSAEQMERHGKRLATQHEVRATSVPDALLKRLAENEAALARVCDLLVAASAAGRRVGPSGEWLLDNFYLLSEQIRVAKRHLPPGYSAQLPQLKSGPSAGRPRVYDIALEAIAHGDGRVDADSISRFIRAYQSVTPLKLGELWAIPIMLRLALIENLRRVGMQIAQAREERDIAQVWADLMIAAAAQDPNSLILIVADMARSAPPITGPFVAELVRRLQGRTSALALPLTWLEQRLSESGSAIEQFVQVENQHQAADQVSVSNSVGSLRFLNALDWRVFVESTSVVEKTLLEDPAGLYAHQDFGTRDRYRHVIESLAQRCAASEHEIARCAVSLAGVHGPTADGDLRQSHVGFYLVDAGLAQLERAVTCRRTVWARLHLSGSAGRLAAYLTGVALIAGTFSGLCTWKAFDTGLPGELLPVVALLAAIVGSQIAISVVNLVATLLRGPQRLPRMDFSKEIPETYRSLVVVPAMLTSVDAIESLIESLEVRFLANHNAQIYFGLLTDFSDAPTAALPEDEQLLALARSGIEALNAKYPGACFFLFHRNRRWNARDKIWMGRERKRGKLEDLNALLRGRAADAFAVVVGEARHLRSVRYVITLDTDTQLPRDAARQMIETMAHPLNRAFYDAQKRRVTRGYGILQPRVTASVADLEASRYARLSAGEPGIDPYTRAVSDVYQDLFGEGSFIGKGIYDVDAFEQALAGRLPDNRILSHDLLEGSYARAGLLSDVQLFESHPPRYTTDAARRHRWVRGDWQIASWILPRVPHSVRPERNPLSRLARWKIFDNLRRSLVAPALVALLCFAWLEFSSPWLWTLALASVPLAAPALALLIALFRRSEDMTLRQHLSEVGRSARRHAAQALLTLVFLAHEAFYGLDAMLRSSARIVLKRGLLEWTTASEAAAGSRTGFAASWLVMRSAPIGAAAIAVTLAAVRPMALIAAAPLLVLWFAAPAVAWWMSRAPRATQAPLARSDVAFLRQAARRTWAYFEEFVVAADNHLPPDNYQEDPGRVIAHRTSPTNMGMALLANVSAYDFGYLAGGALLERTTRTFATMQMLERYEGHFYNWYDTSTLAPLSPLYVSSVDSGNLAGYLMVLKSALLGLPEAPIVHPQVFGGLSDTLHLAGALQPSEGLARIQDDLARIGDAQEPSLEWIHTSLTRVAASLNELDSALGGDADSRSTRWTRAAVTQARQALDDIEWFAPWISAPGAGGFRDGIPSLTDLAVRDDEAGGRARSRIAEIERLACAADELSAISYDFLYDRDRHLLAIGYNVSERRRDSGYYDLLASEARFTVFTGIAQQKLPQESWFALGRLLTHSGGRPVLMSWSGSMFEYLMPLLVMPTYAHTLLDNSYRAVVERQIAYGRQRDVPWGMSESGYNTFDAARNYQYRAFGVPGVGLARGLADDLVIAPYASALALMVDPHAACRNLQQLASEGAAGEFGFYEAVDYAPARMPPDQSKAVVKSFMAHHQGMTLLALGYALLDRPMQKRLERLPEFQATLLLLHERIPKPSAPSVDHTAISKSRGLSAAARMSVRVLTTADTPSPEVQLLSNGRYHVMVTNAGGGYSRWKDLSITRWREDPTRDHWGTFLYVRDVATGAFWSSAHHPTAAASDAYEAHFSESRVEFRRRDHDYETRTEIVVSPEDDIELRRLHITNRASEARDIDVTSYSEIVLATAAADAAHPAFSNLFVQTEIVAASRALLATRRPRSEGERVPWMFHQLAVRGASAGQVSYETDRARFIGRGGTVASPAAMGQPKLSGASGSVLDPIASIRCRLTLPAHSKVTIDLVFGAAETREESLALIGKYRDSHLADRVFDLSHTHSLVALRQINAAEADVQLYARLAGAVLYANPALRADAATLIRNRRGQPDLWGYAISGDLPIVLLKIGDPANIDLVRQLVQAHAYWRLKGLAVDLVIWNEDRIGYLQVLQDRIMGLITAGIEAQVIDRPGGIFVRRGDQISEEDRLLLQAVARVIISDQRGPLADQIAPSTGSSTVSPLERRKTRRAGPREAVAAPASPPLALTFANGIGGYSADGREYVITTTADQVTPAPWANVLANPHFGTLVSESGPSYTWSENAHEFRLTPWHNDAVSDGSGEAFYLRDEDTGDYWSPTPLPCRGSAPYTTRHGFGYSVYEHAEAGIESELEVFVATDAPIKFSVLRVTNVSGRARRLSAAGYVEWVLGDSREKTAMHVVTEIEPVTGAVCARNRYNTEFAGRVAFFDVDDPGRTVTGDRAEFIGRNGSLAHPAAMKRVRLSNRLGAGFDPCAGLHVGFSLAEGETRELIFRLGVGGGRGYPDAGSVTSLLERFRGSSAPRRVRESISSDWQHTLGAIRVSTPDAALDMLANGWLVYQTLACRMWARSGYYQSGGAFGFRDQLQDAMALVHADSNVLREQLLLCASRQYAEGDVQHWWHPPSGRGVRTRCSDDLLWLPLAIARYVATTADTEVLTESIHFLEGRPVEPREDSYYDLPRRSDGQASLYEHGVRAIRKALRTGAHGLPLMGTGDWNDGMNLVGEGGQGESVWLGFFMHDVLTRFAVVARGAGDEPFADWCTGEARSLARHIEDAAWDGEWYLRAFFDDGTPLGSHASPECSIDSISQSWAVLSGAADNQRARAAMDAVSARLVRRDDGLMQLLDPPFDNSALNPGYIKGYVPGVRENGGQYTHAAIWAAMAYAKLGDRSRAWELFTMLNPINHARGPVGVAKYKVEPYVVAADVYGRAPHVGRGGWTWYTGSAGWMYRLIVESLLGLTRDGDHLILAPCVPDDWQTARIEYRFGDTTYDINMVRATVMGTSMTVSVDGIEQAELRVTLVDDAVTHNVTLVLPSLKE